MFHITFVSRVPFDVKVDTGLCQRFEWWMCGSSELMSHIHKAIIGEGTEFLQFCFTRDHLLHQMFE